MLWLLMFMGGRARVEGGLCWGHCFGLGLAWGYLKATSKLILQLLPGMG